MKPRLSLTILLPALLLATSLLSSAQGRRDACGYHNYEFVSVEDTPPPEGFKPFYISHFGRHGARYLTPSAEKGGAYNAMKGAGTLTPRGEELMKAVTTVHLAQKGHTGRLAPNGERQHRMLAERMADRFPEVFDGSGKKVIARASILQRCRRSMRSFTDALEAKAPGLMFDKSSGVKYYLEYSRMPSRTKTEKRMMAAMSDSLLRSDFSPERFVSEYFATPPENPYSLCRKIFIYAADCQCIGLETDLYPFFSEEEIGALRTDLNARTYAQLFSSTEFGGKLPEAARPLLKSIIKDTDMALKDGSGIAAHLRFGHDSGLVPLACLIGLEGYAPALSVEKGRVECPSWERIPMAANLQIVFYKNSPGTVLVKFLVCERETLIHGLRPLTGPYYLWSDIRETLASRLGKSE